MGRKPTKDDGSTGPGRMTLLNRPGVWDTLLGLVGGGYGLYAAATHMHIATRTVGRYLANNPDKAVELREAMDQRAEPAEKAMMDIIMDERTFVDKDGVERPAVKDSDKVAAFNAYMKWAQRDERSIERAQQSIVVVDLTQITDIAALAAELNKRDTPAGAIDVGSVKHTPAEEEPDDDE